MIAIPSFRRAGPIGIDLGSRSVKLVQLSGDRTRVIESVRWDLPTTPFADFDELARRWTTAVAEAREGRRFRGREAVVCLGPRELHIQSLRIVRPPNGDLDPVIRKEITERPAFPVADCELRYLETADVRQGDIVRREVIVLGCRRTMLDRYLQVLDDAGLRPVAVDVEPQSLLRCYNAQNRRDADQQQRSIVVHIGYESTAVVIAEGNQILFVKYIEPGGKHFDDAVARHLNLEPAAAWTLRRNNGDRRADQQDPEIVRSVNESLRPVIDRLANEVSLCIRYHSVTFRGQTLSRLVLGGGEATQNLVERLAGRLDLRCELGDPFRVLQLDQVAGRRSQWDVAVGMALRETEDSA